MASLHQHRLLFIIPVARVAAVVTRLRADAGADACPDDAGPPLNASGLAADPVTHRWLCGAYTDAECRLIMRDMAQAGGVTPLPTLAQWNGWTGQQKRTWAASVRDTIYTAYGVWVQLMANNAAWDDFAAALAAKGLKTIAPAAT